MSELQSSITHKQTVKANYEWTLTAYEDFGNLWLQWDTNAPFRAQQDQIVVYKGFWPTDPATNSVALTWSDPGSNTKGWDTGLRYGSGWHCARIAQSPPNGKYVYFVKLITKYNSLSFS
jgi:hypothetical protein